MIFPPLVSARAYREAVARYTSAEARTEHLTEQLIRIARRAQGMTETTPEKRHERIEIPGNVLREIAAYESPAIQQQRKAVALKVWRETKSWGEALSAIEEEE